MSARICDGGTRGHTIFSLLNFAGKHFNFDAMLIKNNWYIVCASVELSKGLLPVVLGNESLVVFRDSKNQLHVLRDRCPHRFAKLSQGQFIGDKLECPYHGWQFNFAGACVRIPSQPPDQKIPPSFCVEAFVAQEKYGFIWAWIGEEQNAQPTYEISVPNFDQHSWVQGVLDFDCHYQLLVEGTLDITHFDYLHGDNRFIKKQQKATTHLKFDLETSETGFTATQTTSPQDWYRLTFQLPSLVIIEFFANGVFKNRSFIYIVPTGDQTCRVYYLIMTEKKLRKVLTWLKKAPQFFMQDKVMLESIQKIILKNKDLQEKSVESDVAAIWSRKVIASAEKNNGRYEFPNQKKTFGLWI